MLDEAIRYQQVAIQIASDDKSADEKTALTLMQAARTAAQKEK
jgi:hypothetical protein